MDMSPVDITSAVLSFVFFHDCPYTLSDNSPCRLLLRFVINPMCLKWDRTMRVLFTFILIRKAALESAYWFCCHTHSSN